MTTWWCGTELYNFEVIPGIHVERAIMWLLILGRSHD